MSEFGCKRSDDGWREKIKSSIINLQSYNLTAKSAKDAQKARKRGCVNACMRKSGDAQMRKCVF